MPTSAARAQAVFLAAADVTEPAARLAYLDAACAGDAALRQRVEALLRAHDQPDSLLDAPIVPPAGDETRTVAPDGDANRDKTEAQGEGGDEDRAEALSFLAPPTRPDSLGRIGHYEVLQVLGKGGFGIVFRAFDDVLQRVVAVKVMAPQLAATSPARKRFLREARTSAAVRHENVVQVYEVGEQPLPYLVMEFIPGETLQERLNRTGPLDVAEVMRIGRQIAEGLAAAHATDLIHRDIKPANVLIEGGPQHRVKITDFGLARAADDASISQSGIIAGTPMYMAPEQAQGQTLDQRADLFSLGSVLYQMAAGRPPFRANTTVAVLKRVAEDTPRAIREIIPETPQWLCDIITKLHAKNPDDRFQTAREVTDVLADCEAQLKAHAKVKDLSRIPRGKTASLGRRKWVASAPMLLALVAGVLAIIAIAATMFWITGDSESVNPAGPPPLKRMAWGEVVDPLGNSQLSETNGRLTITVPGDQSYDLNPLPSFNLSAPRVLKAIEGDFEAQVTVLPFPRPRIEMGIRPEAAYVGAGLVVWQDDTSLLRLFRAGMGHNNGGAPYVHVEWFAAGKHEQKSVYVGDGPLHLRIRCSGGILNLSHSSDGREWTDPVPPVADLPLTGNVRVGVAAVNALNREFTARFEGFEIKGLPPSKSAATPPSEPGFVSLFNGKDLTGWKTPPADRTSWRVENGILVGSGNRSTLFTERSNFGNFHLRMETRVKRAEKGGAIGIAARVPFEDPLQISIAKVYDHNNRLQPQLVWCFDRGARTKGEAIPEDEWFTHQLIMNGGVVTMGTTIGNKTWSGSEQVGPKTESGHIALQLFDDWSVVEFRKIEIKELPPGTPVPDEDRLQGTWVPFEAESGGKKMPAERLGGMTFTGDKVYVTVQGRQQREGTFKLGANKDPKEIDVIRNEDFRGMRGIYRFDGDVLTLCADEPGPTRPTKFETTPDTGTLLLMKFRKGPAAATRDGFVSLFNGKDLTGWRSILKSKITWTWADGVLTAKGVGDLVTERNDYENFHLRLSVKTNLHSGAWVRLRDAGVVDGDHYITGIRPWHESSILVGGGLTVRRDKQQTGLAHNADVGPADQWHTLEIIAVGNRFRTLVNGKPVADVTDPDNTRTRGSIALSLLGQNPREAHFKNVEIKELPPNASAPLPPTFKNDIGMEFVKVPKGKSWLGGGKDKPGDKEVQIPADFYLGKYEVTQEEWIQVMGENPSHFSRTGEGKDAVKDISDADLKRFPVEQVSWEQCQIFVAKLNKLAKETGWLHRLPTEAEWEYACRGGPMSDKANSAFDFYLAQPTNELLPARANVSLQPDRGLKRTCRVGSYESNPLGLSDMHGNIYEWCGDAQIAADGATHRASRGGDWNILSGDCRAASRYVGRPSMRSGTLGLRLARVPSGAPAPAAKTPPAVAPVEAGPAPRLKS